MREIKFRAWDRDKKTMVCQIGEWRVRSEHDELCFPLEPFVTSLDGDSYKFVLMQFTGLSDRNGKAIFEGDIVKILDYYAKVGIVEFSPPRFCIFDGDDGITDFDQEEWEYFEVVGNIYENPELLEKKGHKDV